MNSVNIEKARTILNEKCMALSKKYKGLAGNRYCLVCKLESSHYCLCQIHIGSPEYKKFMRLINIMNQMDPTDNDLEFLRSL